MAIANTTLARPYAKAAFEYAVEHNQLADWARMLNVLAVLASDPKMKDLIHHPLVTKEELTTLFTDICSQYFNEAGINFLKLLIERKRLELASEIFAVYTELEEQYQKTLSVDVISYLPLDEKEQAKLASKLEQKLQRKVLLDCQTDKSILGGVIVKAGDMVFDGSARKYLLELERNLFETV